MRVAVISDIHANLVALDAVLIDAERAGVDRVVCLGDIVDLGPQPVETVARLRADGVACVRGNHDPLDEPTTLPQLVAVQAWTQDQLAAETRAFLSGLPPSMELALGDHQLLCVHGSPRSDTDSILAATPDEDLAAFFDIAFDVMVCGHTHVQLMRRYNERLFVNVGSVGMPFAKPYSGQGAPRVLRWGEYAIVESVDGVLSANLRRVPYAFELFADAMRASTFPDVDLWLSQWSQP